MQSKSPVKVLSEYKAYLLGKKSNIFIKIVWIHPFLASWQRISTPSLAVMRVVFKRTPTIFGDSNLFIYFWLILTIGGNSDKSNRFVRCLLLFPFINVYLKSYFVIKLHIFVETGIFFFFFGEVRNLLLRSIPGRDLNVNGFTLFYETMMKKQII